MLANTERGSDRAWILMSTARRHATVPRKSFVAESGISSLYLLTTSFSRSGKVRLRMPLSCVRKYAKSIRRFQNKTNYTPFQADKEWRISNGEGPEQGPALWSNRFGALLYGLLPYSPGLPSGNLCSANKSSDSRPEK